MDLRIIPIALIAFVISVLAYLPDSHSRRRVGGGTDHVTSISFGTPYRYNQAYPTKYGYGDVWNLTWARDGNLYSICDDCLGANNAVSGGRNVLFTSFSAPDTSATITNVNTMDAYSTGLNTSGSDGKNIKGFGNISVQGTIYVTTARQTNPSSAPYRYAESGTQIIKSSNLGATFTPVVPSPNNPFTSPMWPTPSGPLWYAQYPNQDYTGQTWDGSDTYVYGIQNELYWNNDDNVYLGRVTITNIGNLNAADWSWYQGGDGANPANWGSISTRVPILTDAGKIGATTAQFIPFCSCYVMIEWYYPTITPSFDSSTSVWKVYTARHLWGQWILINTITWNPQGYYAPVFIPKSVAADGGHTAMLTTTGDFGTYPNPPGSTLYTPTFIPVTLQ